MHRLFLLFSLICAVLAETELDQRLLNASKEGNLASIGRYIKQGANINARGEHRLTALHMSAGEGHLGVTRYLVENAGANIDSIAEDEVSPLHVAALMGKNDITRYLLDHGAEINRKARDDMTALHIASSNGYLDVVKSLVEKGADISMTDSERRTAEDHAKLEGNTEIVEFLKKTKDERDLNAYNGADLNNDLLDAARKGNLIAVTNLVRRGANVRTKDVNDGWTSLHRASHNGHLGVVKYLVEQGAEIDAKDDDNWTSLHYASHDGHLAVAEFLVEKGANINAKENNGRTPQDIAQEYNETKVVEMLKNAHNRWNDNFFQAARTGNLISIRRQIENGANITAKDEDGWSALHHAARYGKLDVVRYLLENGAKTEARDNEGWTALHHSSHDGSLDVTKYLVEHGSLIDAESNEGWTALHHAASYGHIEIVKYLVANGANKNATDKNGKTPQNIAQEYGETEIADILGNRGIQDQTTTTTTTTESLLVNIFTATPLPTSSPSTPQVSRPAVKACQRYSVWPTQYIVSGMLANTYEFPWMAALAYMNDFNYSVSFDCGGTIISEWYVLTAAHCMKRGPPSMVRVGANSLIDTANDRAVNYRVDSVIKHPDWMSIRRKNDIALIRVIQRIAFNDFVMPACLHTDLSDISQDKKIIVTGWGTTTSERIRVSNELRKAELISSPLHDCNRTFIKYNEIAKIPSFENGISEGQYCAHDPVNHSDSCQGDSGGPLQFFPNNNSLGHVVGVVSFGIDCATNLPGIYTRVAYYLDWIESVVWPNRN